MGRDGSVGVISGRQPDKHGNTHQARWIAAAHPHPSPRTPHRIVDERAKQTVPPGRMHGLPASVGKGRGTVFTLPAVPLLLRRRVDPVHLRMALCTEDTRPATTKHESVRALGGGCAHPQA